MGERGQILIKDTGIYLYTHWRGERLKEILQTALKKRWRWDDDEYLARIIYDVMAGDEQGEETGFGIGVKEHGDLNYPLLVVDVKNQMVIEEKLKWTFEEFCKQKL